MVIYNDEIVVRHFAGMPKVYRYTLNAGSIRGQSKTCIFIITLYICYSAHLQI